MRTTTRVPDVVSVAAADTITALRAEVERLREALEAIDKRYINGADAKTLVWIARSALAKAPA